MILSPAGLGPERDCAGEAKQQQQITDLSLRQRGRHKITKPQLKISRRKKNWSRALIVA
jgi:hypothetical protein